MDDLADDVLAHLRRISELIQTHGPDRVREPHVKHLQGPLWELRLKGRDGIARAIYVVAKGKRVIIVRAFVKKTQKTPTSVLKLALKRAKEVL